MSIYEDHQREIENICGASDLNGQATRQENLAQIEEWAVENGGELPEWWDRDIALHVIPWVIDLQRETEAA